MTDLPSLWDILDSYLNTNDYDDGFHGWVAVDPGDHDGLFTISFNSAEDNTTVRWRLRKERGV